MKKLEEQIWLRAIVVFLLFILCSYFLFGLSIIGYNLVTRMNIYKNTYKTEKQSFLTFVKWRFGQIPQEKNAIEIKESQNFKPVITKPGLTKIYNPDPSKIQITWIGHSTVLIQVGGLNILTDPIFSERCSPFSFLGPKRHTPPAISLEELPAINIVLISHNHYDHLDSKTIKILGDKSLYLVPKGIGQWLHKRGITNVVEFNWWENLKLNKIVFNSVPVQHFSSRMFFDYNNSLWCGWVIESKYGKVFYAGDTGYSRLFKALKKRFGPIKVAILPIGSYMPRYIFGSMHLDPPEALLAHKDLGAAHSIPVHWGAFKLTAEPIFEPPLYMQKVLMDNKISPKKFSIINIGETKKF
jgi:N-acyl-phosphatidylethanolamine-hydrolysing phospholipase D